MSGALDPSLVRWRHILGEASAEAFGSAGPAQGEVAAIDAALDWLYDRDRTHAERDVRGADLAPSSLTVPEWIGEITRLFPKDAVERLQRDAIEEFGLHEVVTSEEVLRRVEPSETLLRAVLQTKALMEPRVLALARELVQRVVRRLVEKLAREVRVAFGGSRSLHRTRHPFRARFDAAATLRANLHRFDVERQRLIVDRPRFRRSLRRDGTKWQLVLLVDQSGSMVGSVVHAAVTAACLWGLPSFRTHLVAFDTSVVDLTPQVTDPVELLMRVQLGGGTDIAGAVRYAESLIVQPRRAVVVLVSDLFEGGDAGALVRTVARITSAGGRFLALAALDAQAEPVYDAELGRRLVEVGAEVGAMTPNQLVAFLAEVLG
ncbi:MAG: VWA domain-containing protein [Myxococcota bacterium]